MPKLKCEIHREATRKYLACIRVMTGQPAINIKLGARSSPANWPGLRDFAACSRTLAASLSTLPHCFPFIFPTFRRAGFA